MTLDIADYTGTTWPEPEHIAHRDLKVLGTVRRSTYAETRDGRELRIAGPLPLYEQGNKPKANEVRIDHVQLVPDPIAPRQRPPSEEVTTYRAFVVEPGTYAAAAEVERTREQAKQRAAVTAAAPHFIDLAATFPQLDREPERPVALGISDNVAADMMRKSPTLLVAGGRDPVRGIEAIAEWIDAELGAPLEAMGDYLSDQAITYKPTVAAVILAFYSLLWAYKAGRLPSCPLKHKSPVPAWTLTANTRMPICRDHLEGSDR